MGMYKKITEEQISLLNKIPEVDRAYIAGIIDGEGTISIFKWKSQKKRGANTYLRPAIIVSNTNKSLIDWIHTKFGGGVVCQRKKHFGKKIMYTWEFYSTNFVKEILKLVMPYLIVKKKNAEIVLEFLNNKIDRHTLIKRITNEKGQFIKGGFTKTEIPEQHLQYYRRIRELSKQSHH